MGEEIIKGVILEHTPDYIHIAFNTPHQVISSAVLNGGLISADHLVNMKVSGESLPLPSPEDTLLEYSRQKGWLGTIIGMMTAASMDSFRVIKETEQGIDIVVLVTTGLSNARRIGDYAEYRHMTTSSITPGTINIILITSAVLIDAAAVEALLMITEAKTAALQEAGIISPVSNGIATGTGTDSAAVVSGKGPEQVHFCGKHVLFGEMLGRMVKKAVLASVQKVKLSSSS